MTERRLADFYALALLDDKGLESYSLGPLTRYPVSWPVEDVERYCEETANEIRNRNYHMYHVMYVKWAVLRWPSQRLDQQRAYISQAHHHS